MIYSRDLYTCNAKYFQTLSGEKWRCFANSLRNMLELRSTLHEVVWQFNNLAYSSGLMFGRVIYTIAFRSLFSPNGYQREQNYTEIVSVGFRGGRAQGPPPCSCV